MRRSSRAIGPPAGAPTRCTGPVMPEPRTVLEVTNLKKHFPIKKGLLRRTAGYVYAVDGVSLKIRAGETLALVGESGCGKSTVGRTILRLIEPTDGQIKVNGTDITHLTKAELRPYRRQMQIIFQDPFSSLDPRMSAGDIVGEPLRVHGVGNAQGAPRARRRHFPPRRAARRACRQLSASVLRRAAPAHRHRARARARAEPDHRRRAGLGARRVDPGADPQSGDGPAGRVRPDLPVHLAQSRGGRACQPPHRRDVSRPHRRIHRQEDAVHRGLHPYTESLLAAVPVPDPAIKRKKIVLQGDVPSPVKPPPGCHFHTRCPYAIDRCRVEDPEAARGEPGRACNCVALCHLAAITLLCEFSRMRVATMTAHETFPSRRQMSARRHPRARSVAARRRQHAEPAARRLRRRGDQDRGPAQGRSAARLARQGRQRPLEGLCAQQEERDAEFARHGRARAAAKTRRHRTRVHREFPPRHAGGNGHRPGRAARRQSAS